MNLFVNSTYCVDDDEEGLVFYDRGLPVNQKLTDDLINQMLAEMPVVNDDSVFRVADVGCSDSGRTLNMWRSVLPEIRRYASKRPIEVVYSGLFYENYISLFDAVFGKTEQPTYMNELDNVHVFLSNSSVYDSISSKGSLDLIFSSTSVHHLSSTPCALSNHLHMVGATGPQRAAFQARGRLDWESFLVQRASEMKVGARLFMFNFCIDRAGHYFGGTRGYNLWNLLSDLWDGLSRDGVITRDEFLNTNFSQCFLTQEEFEEPFHDEASPVYQAGLRLEMIEQRVERCLFEADFAENHKDPKRFCDEYVAAVRLWAERTFIDGLDHMRLDSEKVKVVDLLFKRLSDHVEANCYSHSMDSVHVFLVCKKT